MNESIYIGQSDKAEHLHLKWANRHGLIAGATGTGKTVSLQVLAEGFSAAGVPVFLADVKGDLSGISCLGAMQSFLTERAAKIGLKDYKPDGFPVTYWDFYGEKGHPVRTTISEMGPMLLARALELNDTQEGVLNVAFRLADEEGLLLLDVKDLRALLTHIGERSEEISRKYGNVAAATLGTIQRRLLEFENQDAERFFGEPALEISDLMRTETDGRGVVNILAADKLVNAPRLYGTFLLWLLSELFEELPEAGDLPKPKLVFFFDEAHLLFTDAPAALLQKIEQMVRLIRSKGVGVYFVTQSPTDIPESVLAQLGNCIQHALRAYTPKGQKDVKVAADTFRPNPDFQVAEAITQLGVGEALVSVLEGKGEPSVVQKTLIRPPSSLLGPAPQEARAEIMRGSLMGNKYHKTVDRESAFELLQARAEKAVATDANDMPERYTGTSNGRGTSPAAPRAPRASNRQGVGEALVKSAVRTIGSQIGREIIRGVMGSILRSGGRR